MSSATRRWARIRCSGRTPVRRRPSRSRCPTANGTRPPCSPSSGRCSACMSPTIPCSGRSTFSPAAPTARSRSCCPPPPRKPSAAPTLEDLEGAIEVLFFPATYAGCAVYLAEDAILLVKGRLDRREESPKLVAMEVSAPDLAATRSGPFVVTLPVQRCVPAVVERLQEVLRSHPGPSDVHLRLGNGRRTTVVKLDDKLRVKP